MYHTCCVSAPGYLPFSMAVCGDCILRGIVKELASEQIPPVTSLCKAGKSYNEIVSITSISLCTALEKINSVINTGKTP